MHLTPSTKPLALGDVVILRTDPKGFVGVIVALARDTVDVMLLDSWPGQPALTRKRVDVIQTGKRPEDLVAQYVPSPQSLSTALAAEREYPDFSRIASSRKATPKTQKPKPKLHEMVLSNEQKAQIREALRDILKEAQANDKETS